MAPEFDCAVVEKIGSCSYRVVAFGLNNAPVRRTPGSVELVLINYRAVERLVVRASNEVRVVWSS